VKDGERRLVGNFGLQDIGVDAASKILEVF